jgi:type I restriction enzyme S subunit
LKAPRQWQAKRLKYAVHRSTEKVLVEPGSRYVGLENIESWTGRYLPTEAEIEAESVRFRSGDVLFGKLRPYLAKVHVARTDGTCTSEMLVLRPGAQVSAEFLFYRLVSADFIDLVNSTTFGSKMPRADWEQIGNIPVGIPGPDEQANIVSLLDGKTAEIDLLQARKQRLIGLLDEKRAALISRAVTRGLDPQARLKDSGIAWMGEVPAHWKEHRLSGLAGFVGGSTPTIDRLDYWGGDIFWASPKDMKVSHLSQTEDRITDTALREWGMVLLQPPAVLLVVRGMILAHSLPVAVSQVPLTINQDMKALVVRPGCSAEFLMRWFQGTKHGLASLIEQSAHGTRCLRTDLLKQVRCFLPRPDEQAQICQHIWDNCAALGEARSRMSKAIDRLREYRSALITAAVTGQFDIRKHEKKMEALN